MVFIDFLKRARADDAVEGDFIADARDDRMFPRVDSWSVIEDYLVRMHDVPTTITAAGKNVWSRYQGWQAFDQRQTN